VLNGVEDRVSIVDGHEQIYLPVQGKRFGYIISDPPFEPTPPGMDNFYHSAGGPYGLDFLDKILRGLDEHLTDDGHAQIVTGGPGDEKGPSLLLELVEKHLSGTTTVLVNPASVTFDEVMDLVAEKKMGPVDEVDALRRRARKDGVTHIHLCLIHHEKGPGRLRVEPTRKVYAQYWNLPLPELSGQSGAPSLRSMAACDTTRCPGSCFSGEPRNGSVDTRRQSILSNDVANRMSPALRLP
jgi:release factor glutamine methyltransferase